MALNQRQLTKIDRILFNAQCLNPEELANLKAQLSTIPTQAPKGTAQLFCIARDGAGHYGRPDCVFKTGAISWKPGFPLKDHVREWLRDHHVTKVVIVRNESDFFGNLQAGTYTVEEFLKPKWD